MAAVVDPLGGRRHSGQVSVGKRFWDVARSNLNDFATAFRRDDDGLTDEERAEVEAEVRRTLGGKAGGAAGRAARVVRDRAEEAWEKAFEASQARRAAGGMPPGFGGPSLADQIRWHKTLEVPMGAPFEDIRKNYRRLVREYHPDRYAQDPEKYRAATAVATKITEAYNGLKAVHGQ